MSILSRIAQDIESAVGIKSAPPSQSMLYPNQPNGLPAGPGTKPIIMNNPTKDAGASKTVQANQFLAAEKQAINNAGGTDYASAPPGMMELAQNMPQGLHGLSYAMGLMHGHQLAIQNNSDAVVAQNQRVLPHALFKHSY